MEMKNLRAVEQNESGLNTIFVNVNTGRHITREQAIAQIEKGNPTYGGYHVVSNPNGLDYIRSNPDSTLANNLE